MSRTLYSKLAVNLQPAVMDARACRAVDHVPERRPPLSLLCWLRNPPARDVIWLPAGLRIATKPDTASCSYSLPIYLVFGLINGFSTIGYYIYVQRIPSDVWLIPGVALN